MESIRHVRRSFLQVGLAVSLGIQAVAPVWAEPLSLPELLEEVHRVNPSLREARTRWEAAQARVPLSKALPAPRIGVEWEEIPKGSFKVNQAMLMYQLIQSLPFPGKLSARHRVAVKEAQVAAMVFKQAEWDVVTDLKAAYYDLFLIDRQLESQQEQVAWLQQAVAAAEARYATGAGAQAELLMLQADALEAANEAAVLTQRRQAMAAHLNHLLNRHSHHPVGEPPPIALEPLTFTPEELMLLAEAHQPELLAFKFSMERAEAAHALAKRELLPDLETMVELRDPAMGPIGPWDLSLALVLPFWFWTKARYGVKAALYDQRSAEAAYEAMRNEIAKRIHEHWHEAFGAYLTAKLCEDQLLDLASQAVGSALAAYQSGRGSALDVIEALRSRAERRRVYAEHLAAFEQHLVMLEEAVGLPLQATHMSLEVSGGGR